MSNRIKKALCLMLSIFMLIPAMPAYAASVEQGTTESTDQVAIELESLSYDKDAYLPGEETGYSLVLRNKLGPSWVRVKITLSDENLDVPFTEDNLTFCEDWVKRGGYWYYTQEAEAYTDYEVISGMNIPDADAVREGASVTISADADAVQYSAINPDFSKDDPWEGTDVTYSTTSHSSHGGSSSSVSSALTMYSSPQASGSVSTGSWEAYIGFLHQWKFKDSYGNYAVNGWIYTLNPYSTDDTAQYDWFHFDENGIMTHGWLKTDDDIWYYTWDENDGNFGRLVTGWYTDKNDGRTYYFDPNTGIMLSGLQQIGGRYYYFAKPEDSFRQNWFWDTTLGRWVYDFLGFRTYGSLYVNEETPVGLRAGADGALME